MVWCIIMIDTDKFGKWSVLDRPQDALKWRCRCDCGVEKLVNKYNLLAGKSTSCGCDRALRAVALGKKNARHGMDGTPTYRSWVEMRRRCRAINRREFPDYRGRGISVYSEWDVSFEAFYRDVGERPSLAHSIDRYPDNDGDYAPGNVRWATMKEQSNNRRSNRLVEVAGVIMTIAQAVDATGKPRRYWLRIARTQPNHDVARMRRKA